MTRPEPASAMALRLPASGWEDVLDALGAAAEQTTTLIDCTTCATATSCDRHDEDWSRVDRWRALAAELRGQLSGRTAG
jgi:hypothetical protein